MLAAMTEFKHELVSGCGLMWVSLVCVHRWEELAKSFSQLAGVAKLVGLTFLIIYFIDIWSY